MSICAICGEEGPDRFRFCGACGAALERKVVSVLFCDLVGLTGRSERMDVEEVAGRGQGCEQGFGAIFSPSLTLVGADYLEEPAVLGVIGSRPHSE
jgi:hypothetical protein